jgi:beta-glucuronidase
MKNAKLTMGNIKIFKNSVIFYLLSIICYLSSGLCVAQETSSEYVNKGWAAQGKKDFQEVYRVTDECVVKFSSEADRLAGTLTQIPPKGKIDTYQIMNDVATCYFIKAETLRTEGKTDEAVGNFEIIINKYPFAQAFDPRGWYWIVKDKAIAARCQLTGEGCPPAGPEPIDPVDPEILVKLSDRGTEFPVNYEKYGKFTRVGSKDYKYNVENPIKLAHATGEGIFPNSNSVKFDPGFSKVKKQLGKIDHWEVLNSRDFRTAFYKWTMAPEPQGVKLFYIADILERSGLIKQAIKAYYAVLVHFPRSYGWTYWHTPWYIGKAALYRLKHILKNNPHLGIKLEDASIEIINGYDNNIRNDIFIVNPGKLKKLSFWDRLFAFKKHDEKRKTDEIIESRGGDKVKLVKYNTGDWQLLLDGKPFMIKGITYAPTRVGESPDDGTLQNWTIQDLNQNNLIDAPFESWVDKNKNNIQDENEKIVGDCQLMKKMGVNTLRVYYQPAELNKELFRQMYEKYGIYIIIGDFLGKYTLGSGADWEVGTDYDNTTDKENMLASVKEMVSTFKDEPYVLMWLLGNENVYGLGCNADKKPESFFKFANEAAKLIKAVDPLQRPVGIASGDSLFLDIFAENCPDIDVFGTNSYRGKYGFLDLWEEVSRTADIPAMITEYGAPSYAKGYTIAEAEDFQAEYHKYCWENIYYNSCGYGEGNALGGFIFEWIDEWWKAYEPSIHDKEGLFSGPFLDGYMHEEWLGLCGQGDGMTSPYLRQLKKSYYTYKKLWQN